MALHLANLRINAAFLKQTTNSHKLKTNRLSVAERGFIGMKPTEEQEQQAVIKACAQIPYKGRTIADYIHHSPNGGKRSKREAHEFKLAGTKAGFPDLILPIARQGYHGLYIEMKSMSGSTSAIQREYMALLASEGYQVEVCKGAKAAIDKIIDYLSMSK